MSQSHPMIQPSSWEQEDDPARAAQTLPADRAAIYKIIWHSSLACAMKPPLLAHTRSVWETSASVQLAIATVHPVKDREGYWLERKDYPAAKWPLNDKPLRFGEIQIAAISLVLGQGPSPGTMIQGVFAAGITTAASIAELFSDLLGKDRKTSYSLKPTALVKFFENKQRSYAAVTDDGAIRLAQWKAAGLLGRVRKRNEIVEDVDHGKLTARDALHQLCNSNSALTPIADLVARQIDKICEQWRGMSRADSLVQQAKFAHKPPVMNALPAWIDPESLLATGHPLRALRERMESDLAIADPAWSMTDEQLRAQRRLEWLTTHASQILADGGGPEFAAAMDPETARFSSLRYWLTGLSTPFLRKSV